ncbi:MAG: Uma2 family endonuclease [Gemmatimonadaceae bacterium]
MYMLTERTDWTADEAQQLPDDGNRYEVIDGMLLMTPSPNNDHQDAVARLHRILWDYLQVEKIGYAAISPSDVRFSEWRAVQPDVFVTGLVDGRRPRNWNNIKQVLLASEVLSPSTARTDRTIKRNMFQSVGVEYWVVDLTARTFERSMPNSNRTEIFVGKIEWMPAGASMPLTIDIADFFAKVLDQ